MKAEQIAGIIIGSLAFLVISAYLTKFCRRWIREWNIENEAIRFAANREKRQHQSEMIELQERKEGYDEFRSTTPYVLV